MFISDFAEFLLYNISDFFFKIFNSLESNNLRKIVFIFDQICHYYLLPTEFN